jgi:hypothetical protein
MIYEGKEMDKKILKLLYRSFDEELKEKEKQHLEAAMKQSEELCLERDRILAQRQALAESSKHSFTPFFAERVMNRIESLSEKKNGIEAFYETLFAMFRRFALAGAAILIILLLYNLRTGDALSTDDIFYTSDVAIENIIDLPLF